MGLIQMLMRLFMGSAGRQLLRVLGPALLAIVVKQMRGGGLNGMLDRFRGAGMGDKVDTWVSTGPNSALSADEVEQAISRDELGQIAEQTGLSVEDVRDKLAKGLPEVVDTMTPAGQVPDDASLTATLDKLARSLPK